MTKVTVSGTPVIGKPQKTPEGLNTAGAFVTSPPIGLDKGPDRTQRGSTEFDGPDPHFPNEVPNVKPGQRQEAKVRRARK